MNRTFLKLAISIAAVALIALLAYSLERTAWLFGLYEQHHEIAIAAAVVVELAAVALIAGAAPLAHLQPAARGWANRALGVVLSTQALANLAAGFLRGGRQTLALFGQPDAIDAYMVAATLWLVTNLAIPLLVLCLSKLLEHLLTALSVQPSIARSPISEATHRLTPAYARPSEPEIVPQAVYPDPIESQFNSQLAIGTPIADRTCRYCKQAGLTQIELAQHGRRYKRAGSCNE